MKDKKYKAKKVAGLIVGLSLAQAGGIILPGMDVLSVVQAAEQEVSSEELAQAVAETLQSWMQLWIKVYWMILSGRHRDWMCPVMMRQQWHSFRR